MSSISYRHDITGLRGFAILSVLIYHAFPELVPGGYLGVDVFFVISGYLISSIIMAELHQDQFCLTSFYQRRIMRLFPSFIVCLCGCMIAGWLWLLPEEYKSLSKLVIAGSGFFANFKLYDQVGYFDVIAQYKPLLHLWSLSIEEQFYLVFPLLMVFLTKRNFQYMTLLIVMAISSFLYMAFFHKTHLDSVFFLPWGRVWELLLGVILANALWLQTRCLGLCKKLSSYRINPMPIIIATLMIAPLFFPREHAYHIYFLMAILLGACLIMVQNDSQLLQRWFCQFFGRISYALYLVHWPVLSFLWILHAGSPSSTQKILALLGSVLVATWMTYGLERKIRRQENQRKTCFYLITLLLSVVALAVAVDINQGLPYRIHGAFKGLKAGFAQACDKKQIVCHFGNKEAKKTMLIYGDSHVGHLSQALIDHFSYNYRIELVWQGACFMGDRVSAGHLQGDRRRRCQASIDYLKHKKGQYYDMVITGQRWEGYGWSKEQDFTAPIQDRIYNFGIHSKRLIIIGSAPSVDFDCEQANYRPYALQTKLCQSHRLNAAASSFIRAASTLKDGAYFFHPSQLLCPDGSCQAIHGKSSFYEDHHHLSYKGAQAVVDALTPWIY